MNSLISGPGWAGSNGNINGDPLFVDEPNGDYHLTAASPAINAGTTIGAPLDDLDGAWRDAQPDIGAFEFGAATRPLLTVTSRAARRQRDGHEHPGGHRLRDRMRRPLRPQRHGHADRNPRLGVGVQRLVGWWLQRHRTMHRDDELRSGRDRDVRAHHPYPDRVAGRRRQRLGRRHRDQLPRHLLGELRGPERWSP